ncbi:YybH family protein [Arthrobacter sp. KNU-44]|uniref:YybH family protein n=1 Tax=unclassified Arthrobacter TaxID=235627 RepID=UPI003F4366FA
MEIRNREILVDELTAVMRGYEAANNTHDIERVLPYIDSDATYWFSDGSHEGRDQVRAAIEATFLAIRDERYVVDELTWVLVQEEAAVCRYRFSWTGIIDGQQHSGRGRGTNVLVRTHEGWQIVHEQLTADS